MFLDAIVFVDDRTGFTLGDPMGGRFVILVTRDGGDTWSEAPANSRPEAMEGEAAFAASGTSLVFANPATWLAWHRRFGGAGLQDRRWRRELDRGTISHSPTRRFRRRVLGRVFGSACTASSSAATMSVPTHRAGRRRSATMAGRHGSRRRAFRADTAPASPCAASTRTSLIAIAVGTTGSDISRDGGRTWSPLDGTAFNAIQFAPSGVAFAVGGRGRVARLPVPLTRRFAAFCALVALTPHSSYELASASSAHSGDASSSPPATSPLRPRLIQPRRSAAAHRRQLPRSTRRRRSSRSASRPVEVRS